MDLGGRRRGWRRRAGEWRKRIDMPLVGGPMRLGSNASHVSLLPTQLALTPSASEWDRGRYWLEEGEMSPIGLIRGPHSLRDIC
jgi:hypothetical protein